jgi:hypothetical protein
MLARSAKGMRLSHEQIAAMTVEGAIRPKKEPAELSDFSGDANLFQIFSLVS